WLGEPRFEKTFTNPKSPGATEMNLGYKIFTLAPGTYTYNLLKITDAGGLVSNIGTVELTVLAPDSNPCNGYDGAGNAYDGNCGDTNGYDGDEDDGENGYDNGYDSGSSSSGSFTAIITSPVSGAKFSRGQNIAVAVTGRGKVTCGHWTLQTPGGEVVTLTPADFVSDTMPGNLSSCK
ncbi:MAG: hypothetical protein O3A36_02235, partial [bacterium]|nr:hypothetical protein [bacterium]